MKKAPPPHLKQKYKEYKETSRIYCRNALKGSSRKESAENKKKAAKAIGRTRATLNAALNERNKGGAELWFKLRYYIAFIKDRGKFDDISFFEQNNSLSQLTLSEQRFQALSNIPIVNEDIKFQLVTNLEQMLTDLNNGIHKKLRKKIN